MARHRLVFPAHIADKVQEPSGEHEGWLPMPGGERKSAKILVAVPKSLQESASV